MIRIGHVRFGTPWDDAGMTRISRIFISHGEDINSIQFQYLNKNGAFVLSEKHGGDLGSTGFDVVKLDHENEHITAISGEVYNMRYHMLRCVTSITFTTNKNVYGPFGGNYRRLSDDKKSFTKKKKKKVYRPYEDMFEGMDEYGRSSEDINSFHYKAGRGFGGFHGSTGDNVLVSIGIYVDPNMA